MGVYPNGSKAWAIPQGPQHYESYVPSLVFNDEASLQDRWEQGHAALKPCIEGGGKCITVATVRMPMPYSREMSNFNPEEDELLMKGFWKFRSASGALQISFCCTSAHAIHYSADADKDPERDGEEWYASATKGYIGGDESYLWKQHMEIDFESTKSTKLLPWWNTYKNQIVIPDIPFEEQHGWKYYAGFDYGKRNCTVWGVYAVDRAGNRYICFEVAGPGEDLGGVPGIAERIRLSDYFQIIGSKTKADPSIWNENQAKEDGGYTSIAKMFKQQGVSFQKAPVKGLPAEKVAIERLVHHYWQDPGEPTLYIFKSCKVHINQFRQLRYQEWKGVTGEDKDLKEELVDKNTDAFDAFKYAEACRPAPKRITYGPPEGSFMEVRKKAIRSNTKARPITPNRNGRRLFHGTIRRG